jgi:hypothetical protein
MIGGVGQMSDRGRKVLIVTQDAEGETELYRRLMPCLVRFECEVQKRPPGVSVFELVERNTFDLVVVGYPIEQPALPALLKSIRWRESACHNTPVLLYSTRVARRRAAEHVNRGVSRMVDDDATEWELESAIGALLEVEARVSLTLPVKLGLPLGGKTERVVAQLDNISTSGMLIRGRWEVEVGAPLTFEVTLPGHTAPICGTAEVVRKTTREREGLAGFGIQFVKFDGDGEQRVADFVTGRIADPKNSVRVLASRRAAVQ